MRNGSRCCWLMGCSLVTLICSPSTQTSTHSKCYVSCHITVTIATVGHRRPKRVEATRAAESSRKLCCCHVEVASQLQPSLSPPLSSTMEAKVQSCSIIEERQFVTRALPGSSPGAARTSLAAPLGAWTVRTASRRNTVMVSELCKSERVLYGR